MNIYVLVEGSRTEPEIYKRWIPLVNPNLAYVADLSAVDDNKFVLFSGNGYPGMLDRVARAIEDVNNYRNIQRLVVVADSEEGTLEERQAEISDYLEAYRCLSEIRIVIQHFCFEAWALGNRKLVSKNIRSARLRDYVQVYNVSTSDPEGLPPYELEEWGRVAFAFRYLNAALNDKYQALSYSKKKPYAIANEPYFLQLKSRLEGTGHIQSFQGFLDAFV